MEETIFSAGNAADPSFIPQIANEQNVDKIMPSISSADYELDGTKFTELFKHKRLQTITYCSVFWSFGLCVAFLGPTLPDLECMVSAVLDDVSWVFFAQSCFTLIGAALAGFVEKRFGSNNTLLVSTAMIGVTLAIVPSCTALWTLAVVLAIMGYFMGMIDTVANLAMIQLYGKQVAPFLQALHFCYGLGAFVSPMVAQPFVRDTDCQDVTVSSRKDFLMTNFTLNLNEPIEHENSRIKYAFWILSGLQIPIIILITFLIIRLNSCKKNSFIPNSATPIVSGKETIEMRAKNEMSDEEEIPSVTYGELCKIVSCIGLVLFIYDGLQAGFGGYVFSYAAKSNTTDMTSNGAAYLNATFWGMFAFGRLISIWISTRISPLFMLMGNISGCFISMLIMIVIQRSTIFLYIGTCLFGIFMSSVYPTAVTLAEMYIPVTSTITSIMVVCAATGEMIMPVAIGHAFHEIGPVSLLIFGLLLTLLSFVVYVMLFFFGQNIVRQSADLNVIGRIKNILKPQSERQHSEDTGVMTHHIKSYRRMKSDVSDVSTTQHRETEGFEQM